MTTVLRLPQLRRWHRHPQRSSSRASCPRSREPAELVVSAYVFFAFATSTAPPSLRHAPRTGSGRRPRRALRQPLRRCHRRRSAQRPRPGRRSAGRCCGPGGPASPPPRATGEAPSNSRANMPAQYPPTAALERLAAEGVTLEEPLPAADGEPLAEHLHAVRSRTSAASRR